MKKILKACNVAFSMYSKIPMPRFAWGTEDMRYHLCFFPVVGAVIGAAVFGWYKLAVWLGLSPVGTALVAMAVPLLFTGGFHVDGFMDTMDALHSYQEREKKLEILKDPHIGAFSVITLVTALLLTAGFLQEIKEESQVLCLAGSFVLSRVFSGLCVTSLPGAREKGMLKTTMDTAGRSVVKTSLWLEGLLTVGAMLYTAPVYAIAVVAANGAVLCWFLWMVKKNFGGITGDLAGCLVVMCETVDVIFVAVAGMLAL